MSTLTEPVPRKTRSKRRHVVRRNDALVRECLRGDQKAWNELVDRYGRLVYSIPRRYGMSEADAEDVFQNVFIILHRHLRTLKDASRLSSWLITTTHRECWRLNRRQKETIEFDEALNNPAPEPDEVERLELQQLVRQALRQMGGPCRALLESLFMSHNPLSYDVIARELGTRVGSIGPTRARCFRKLERILLDLGFDPEN